MLNGPENRLLGCVYLDPPRPSDYGDVIVSWWVIDELMASDIENELDAFVPRWVVEAWPFERPLFDP